MTLPGFHVTPETRSAALAVRRVLRAVESRPGRPCPPLVLHGPPGAGKSQLVAALQAAVAALEPPRTAQILAARDLTARPGDAAALDPLADALRCDLVVIEDLHQLDRRAAAEIERLYDYRQPRGRPLVVTAPSGPALLPGLPARLTSRLTSGLVIGLALPGPESRRRLLERFLRERRLKTRPEVIDWLVAQTPGGVRGLRGAVLTLELLAKSLPYPPTLDQAREHFAAHTVAIGVTLDAIAARVAKQFGRTVKQLRARGRVPAHLWPVQVAMHLSRELLGLPLPKIGQFFGGRDPTTVRYACQKVGAKIVTDPAVAALVRGLREDWA